MELMSSLLLCAFVAFLPQALGFEYIEGDSDLRYNNTRNYLTKSVHKKILLNLNGPPLVSMVSKLQQVFMDVRCKQCLECMERSIKAYKYQSDNIKKRPTVDELHAELLTSRGNILNSMYTGDDRRKRQSDPVDISAKKTKPKKTKKSVTVTKYNVDGEVYALKVQETVKHPLEQNIPHTNQSSMCHLYSVKKSYECDTRESESFLAIAKRKVIKKNRKDKASQATTTTTTETAHFNAPSFKKRQVRGSERPDQLEMPENFDFSLEELY
ncbi:uncharacterized protein LOC142978975 [Anticarsia gemmatalis]|uniref:uncharacterized protein LOC142978975 n=1 Tax=Anticarsia gemmatalis TaxID=129554 RepID=UPI003F75E655